MVFTLPHCGCTSSITLFIGRSDPYPLQKAIAVWMLITYRPNSVMRCSFPGVQQIVGSLREIIVQISPRSYRKRTNEWTNNYNWQQMPLHQSQVIKFLQIKLSPRPPTKKPQSPRMVEFLWAIVCRRVLDFCRRFCVIFANHLILFKLYFKYFLNVSLLKHAPRLPWMSHGLFGPCQSIKIP